MQKVAAISVGAMAFPEEDCAIFGLVQTVLIVIFPQLVDTMGKLAPIFVGTTSKFDEFFAKLQLFFAGKSSGLVGAAGRQ